MEAICRAYPTEDEARTAVERLLAAGFGDEAIRVVAGSPPRDHRREPTGDFADRDAGAAYARGAPGASVVDGPGVTVAVFPDGPERGVYNNAVLDAGLQGAARERALAATEAAYEAAGIGRFAVWTHEGETPMQEALAARGYRVAETTCAMSAVLTAVDGRTPEVPVERIGWDEYRTHLAAFGLPPGLLAGVDARAFDVVGVRRGGAIVAAGLATDREGDCGIYNISTLPAERRNGLGTAVTAALLQAARTRGCATASLQATPVAERLYARLGFRDLGRILEYGSAGQFAADRESPAPQA